MSFNAQTVTLPYFVVYIIGIIIWNPQGSISSPWFWVAGVLACLFVIFIYIPIAMATEYTGFPLLLSMIAGIFLTKFDIAAKYGPVAQDIAPWVYPVILPLLYIIGYGLYVTGAALKRLKRIKAADSFTKKIERPEQLAEYFGDDDEEVRNVAIKKLNSFNNISDLDIAGVIVKAMESIREHPDYDIDFDRERFDWLKKYVEKFTKRYTPNQKVLLLLYENLCVKAFEAADTVLQNFLFTEYKWEDLTPLLESAKRRADKCKCILVSEANLDQTVNFLKTKDMVKAEALAEYAFLAGSLTAGAFEGFMPQTINSILSKALIHAKEIKNDGYDGFRGFNEILVATYTLPPEIAVSILTSLFDESLSQYSLRFELKFGLLGDQGKPLMDRIQEAHADELDKLIAAITKRSGSKTVDAGEKKIYGIMINAIEDAKRKG